MAFALRFVVVAFVAAAAVQVYADDVSVNYNSTYGESSLKISNSSQDLSAFGGAVQVKANGNSQKVQLGLPGGFQAKLVTPLIPDWDDFIKQVNKTAQNISNSINKSIKEAQNNINDFLKNPLKAVQKTISKVNDDMHDAVENIINGKSPLATTIQSVLPNVTLDLPGISNFSDLVENAGGLLNTLEDLGMITKQQLLNISSSVFASALNNSENAIAKLTDTVESAINKSAITVDEGLQVLKMAVDQGLQNITGSADQIVKNFLNSAQVAQKIGSDAVSELNSVAQSISQSVSSGITNTVNSLTNFASSSSSSNDESNSNSDDNDTSVKVQVTTS